MRRLELPLGIGFKNSACLLAASILLINAVPALADFKESMPVAGAAESESSERSLEKGKKGRVKVSYDVRSLHLDGQKDVNDSAEVDWAFNKSKRMPQSGVNSGHRDQYVAGLNHLYANAINQRLSNCFYVQGIQTTFSEMPYGLDQTTSGEQARLNSFDGMDLGADPLVAATIDGIAFLEESLTGIPNLAVGADILKLMPSRNFKISEVKQGEDLDTAWEKNGSKPMICAVNASSKMFGIGGNGFAGHVIVISERRPATSDITKSSKYEYMLLNSWGNDEDGAARNGWVGGDQLVSAMNYLGVRGTDHSLPPSRRDVDSARSDAGSDRLPVPGKNRFAQAGKGLFLTRSPFSLNHSAGVPDPNPVGNVRGSSDPAKEATELKKRISDKETGFTADEIKQIEKDVDDFLNGKTADGKDRPYPLSADEKGKVLFQANRLLADSDKVFKQGLDKGDLHRALIAMVHDSANPDHINQGAHNTCNVTTIMKVETFMRPGAQAKRFVDMYTNENGDHTVSMEK